MRAILAAAIFPIAASCSMAGGDASSKSHPAWMAGRWAWVGLTETIRPGECPHSELYLPNGQMTDGELGEEYRWWIEGDVLVRILTKPMEGEPASEVGRMHRNQFERVDDSDLIFRDEYGGQKMVRCGEK